MESLFSESGFCLNVAYRLYSSSCSRHAVTYHIVQYCNTSNGNILFSEVLYRASSSVTGFVTLRPKKLLCFQLQSGEKVGTREEIIS